MSSPEMVGGSKGGCLLSPVQKQDTIGGVGFCQTLTTVRPVPHNPMTCRGLEVSLNEASKSVFKRRSALSRARKNRWRSGSKPQKTGVQPLLSKSFLLAIIDAVKYRVSAEHLSRDVHRRLSAAPFDTQARNALEYRQSSFAAISGDGA